MTTKIDKPVFLIGITLLLKDYFDKDLFKTLPVARKIRQIKVSYEVEVIDVPAL